VAPPPIDPKVTRDALNDEQRSAAACVVDNHESVFLTGAAGTGKSFLLRYLIDELERRFPGGVAVTASTGIAASHVQGVTVHSWAGIGLGKGSAAKLVEKVSSNGAATARWQKASALVIDEVSMLDSNILDALDLIGRAVRATPLPFGGLLLILCGDFFQLPPVSLGQYGAGFAFDASAWQAARVRTVELRTVVRQQGDSAFIELLAPVRVGVCSEETTVALAGCHVDVKPLPEGGILPTKLYCLNKNVDEENNAHLALLAGQPLTLPASDSFRGQPDPDAQRRLLDMIDKKAPRTLQLKRHAQVLLSKNMPERGLVNGSRGLVTDFVDVPCHDVYGVAPGTYTCPVVHFDNGVDLVVKPVSFFQGGPGGAIVRVQLPLKLAWALTVHKSQGMSLSRAELMLHDAFDYGQVYVALSRVTSLAGLWVTGGRITQRVVMAHPAVLAFYRGVGCLQG
jgi:ATP-dependent DNA helicase PIF1